MSGEVKHSHYKKDVSHLNVLDVYRIQELWKMHPCAEHVVKKMLVAGGRGHKDLDKDIQDCIDTLQRWQDMRKEDGQVVDAACDDAPGAKIYTADSSALNWGRVPLPLRWVVINPGGNLWAFERRPVWSAKNCRWISYGGESSKLMACPGVEIHVAMNSLEQRPT